MALLRKLSPYHAIRDLRAFLIERRPHELAFFALSIVLTGLLIAGFVVDSHVERPYKRDILYVQNWPLTRTDAEIRAQQKIDGVEQTRREAELKRLQLERQASFKRLDDKLKAMGL